MIKKIGIKKKWLFYAIIASLLWVFVNPLIKIGLNSGIAPMNFAGLRFTLSGFFLLIYAFKIEKLNIVLKNKKIFLLLIFGNMLLGYTLLYKGLNLVDSAIASIIMGMTPTITSFLTHFMTKNDKLTRRKIISLIISFIGLLMLVGIGNPINLLDMRGFFGIILTLSAILVQGYCAIKIYQSNIKIDPIFLNGFQMFFGGILIYIFGISVEGISPVLGKSSIFYISFILLVFISMFGFTFWFMALQDKDAVVSEMNMCRLINPILGGIMSWAMLKNESPNFNTVVGMIIIVGALLYYFDIKSLFKNKT